MESELLAFLYTIGGLNWTVMVKDSSVSHGGWFFASVEPSAEIDSFEPPFFACIGSGRHRHVHALPRLRGKPADLLLPRQHRGL
ncbi:hypothetical protein QW131_31805 [Roseibium salinum]|nr:hypothetical protein [Roseibium salinum]